MSFNGKIMKGEREKGGKSKKREERGKRKK
jgi:hypothetical protein